MIMGEPAVLTRLRPGQTVDLGLTRYETFEGGRHEAMYGFRRFLDERGCRFPASYGPPVHWEQLYDMEGAWDYRAEQYTKAAIVREAQKGVDRSKITSGPTSTSPLASATSTPACSSRCTT
jgi:hypothetical protein